MTATTNTQQLPEMTRKRQQKLKGLLYKKSILEHQIRVASIGSKVKMEYVEALQKEIETKPEGSFERIKLESELHTAKREAMDFVSDFKEFRRYYEDGLLGDIQQVVEREQFNDIEFYHVKGMAEDLAKYEIFGKVEVKPANVELIEVNESLKKEIDVNESLITQIDNRLKDNTISDFERAKLNKELFDLKLANQTLIKRYNKRMEYYNDVFLPMYEKDMAECAEKLDHYLEVAKKVIELNIDLELKFMFDEYEKHKDDKEQLWLFYTALRARLFSIGKYIQRNKKKLPKAIDFMDEFFN